MTLREATKLVKSVKGNLNRLTKFGFEKIYTDDASCSTPHIYVNFVEEVVVKRPYLPNFNQPNPPCAVPTKKLHFPLSYKQKSALGLDYDYWNSYDHILIQPLVNTLGRDSALRKLERKYAKKFQANYDLHADNCAFYKGRAVLIDW